jgi:hypothetical protein
LRFDAALEESENRLPILGRRVLGSKRESQFHDASPPTDFEGTFWLARITSPTASFTASNRCLARNQAT